MEVKGGTQALIGILNKTLPHVRETGVLNDMRDVRPDPNGHGKVVLFSWQRKDFRLTSNLNVEEFRWGFAAYTMRMSNEMTADLMARIQKVVNPPVIKQEKEKILKPATPAKKAKVKSIAIIAPAVVAETPAVTACIEANVQA
jgi:hypothetical protein